MVDRVPLILVALVALMIVALWLPAVRRWMGFPAGDGRRHGRTRRWGGRAAGGVCGPPRSVHRAPGTGFGTGPGSDPGRSRTSGFGTGSGSGTGSGPGDRVPGGPRPAPPAWPAAANTSVDQETSQPGSNHGGPAEWAFEPGDPLPAVRRLVVAAARGGPERELPLPALVVAGADWHGTFFHGWCGMVDGPHPMPRLVVRGATVRGATHAGLGTGAQDRVGTAWDARHGALYLAVADGVGSLPRSAAAATEAVRAALSMCAHRPDDLPFEDNGEQLFQTIADGLGRTYGTGTELGDGACTLLVAEVVPQVNRALVTVHGVGDSEAWLLHEGSWVPLHHERRGDNATRELPGHDRPQTHRYEVPLGSVLVLGSDGFTGALDNVASPLAGVLAACWRTAPSWLDFLNHLAFVDDYWSDDRAAVAVWIGEGAVGG